MEEYRTIDTIIAIGLMGELSNKGTIIHSNLDDGFGAQFHDLVNLVGYAKLERYICKELLGARVGHCYGNLFNDPFVRIVFNSAMNKYNTLDSMIYGNTLDFSYNMPKNHGIIMYYAIADTIGQIIEPSGHAITPIPVTDAIRIPSIDEIIEAHKIVDQAIELAKYYKEYIDVQKIRYESDVLVNCGNVFFERVINDLDDMGVDINHPGEIIATLKAIGASQLEAQFGVGEKNSTAMRSRITVKPTAIVVEMDKKQENITNNIKMLENMPLKGKKVIVTATDLHELGKEITKSIVSKAGAKIFDLGTNVAIEEIVDSIIETGSDAVFISTYNGIAYTFGKELYHDIKKTEY